MTGVATMYVGIGPFVTVLCLTSTRYSYPIVRLLVRRRLDATLENVSRGFDGNGSNENFSELKTSIKVKGIS